jgi:hypothetical protein
MSIEQYNYIGNRTDDLSAGSIVPQPTILPCAPGICKTDFIFLHIYICYTFVIHWIYSSVISYSKIKSIPSFPRL